MIIGSMVIRQLYESDGKCFARFTKGCAIRTKMHPKCGTYLCELYKPTGCKDWLKIETNHMVKMFAPEEVKYVKREETEEDHQSEAEGC